MGERNRYLRRQRSGRAHVFNHAARCTSWVGYRLQSRQKRHHLSDYFLSGKEDPCILSRLSIQSGRFSRHDGGLRRVVRQIGGTVKSSCEACAVLGFPTEGLDIVWERLSEVEMAGSCKRRLRARDIPGPCERWRERCIEERHIDTLCVTANPGELANGSDAVLS